MSVSINKDTKIYGSFSKKAGNKGCEFFNKVFAEHSINAIYKSFSINDIGQAFIAALTLKFSGFAVSMPFKKLAYELVDMADDDAIKCQSVNTIIINDFDSVIGYNTDFYGAKKLLTPYRNNFSTIYILGNGGLSGAVQTASSDLGFEIKVITRDNWDEINKLKNSLIYNCTPLELKLNESNCYIDCLIGTTGGDLLNKYQVHKQFELYTGIKLNDV